MRDYKHVRRRPWASPKGADATAETHPQGMAQSCDIFHHPLAFSSPPRPPQERRYPPGDEKYSRHPTQQVAFVGNSVRIWLPLVG